ncbi:MAG: hypothetical protein ABIE22_03255, partial [archaeon]
MDVPKKRGNWNVAVAVAVIGLSLLVFNASLYLLSEKYAVGTGQVIGDFSGFLDMFKLTKQDIDGDLGVVMLAPTQEELDCESDPNCLFFSSWNYDVGSCENMQTNSTAYNSCFDGGKWFGGWGLDAPLQYPDIETGGPGGNNFLNLRTVGGGGWGNPYYFNWEIDDPDGDVFGDPDDLYMRVYFKMHQDNADNIHDQNHWFMATDLPRDLGYTDAKHWLRFGNRPDVFTPPWMDPAIDTLWTLQIGGWESGIFASTIEMEQEKWYCYEINIKKINSTHERWYMRLDGQDITDRYFGISGPPEENEEWLQDIYDLGWAQPINSPNSNFWLTTYDEETLNEGWDVSAIEVRNDNWAGPVECEDSVLIDYYCSCGG